VADKGCPRGASAGFLVSGQDKDEDFYEWRKWRVRSGECVAVRARRRDCGKHGKALGCRGGYTPGVLQKSAEIADCKEVGETLFFKSAQELENKEVSFALFLQKSEKSEGQVGDTEEVLEGDFNTEGTESTENGAKSKRWGGSEGA
jgi:hypothetical protein